MKVTELLEQEGSKPASIDTALLFDAGKEPDHYVRVRESAALMSRGYSIPDLAEHFSIDRDTASKFFWAVMEEWRIERESAFDWYSHVLHSLMTQKRELWAAWENSKKPKVRKTRAKRENSGLDKEGEPTSGASVLSSKTSEETYGNPMILSQIRAVDAEIAKLTGLNKKALPPAPGQGSDPLPPGMTQFMLGEDERQARVRRYVDGVLKASEVKPVAKADLAGEGDLIPDEDIDLGSTTTVGDLFGIDQEAISDGSDD